MAGKTGLFRHVLTRFGKTATYIYMFVEMEAVKNGHTILNHLVCLGRVQMYKPTISQR